MHYGLADFSLAIGCLKSVFALVRVWNTCLPYIIQLFIYLFISEKQNERIKNWSWFINVFFFAIRASNRFESFQSNGLNYLKWNRAYQSCFFPPTKLKVRTRKVFASFPQDQKLLLQKCPGAHSIWTHNKTGRPATRANKCHFCSVFASVDV